MTPDRRRLLGAATGGAALGILRLRLPAALAASSVPSGTASAAEAPTVVPDDTRVTVSWVEIDGATHTIEQSTDGATWTTVAASATSPTVIEGLTNDQLYAFRIVATTETSVTSDPTSGTPRAAMTGGTESVITVGGASWRVHVFDTAGAHTLQVRSSRDVEYLLVGGGGAGGGGKLGSTLGGGGGGAGGLLTNVGGASVAVGSDVAITVGAGGTPVVRATGGNGGDSTALGLTAVGGGGGGGGETAGAAGGSGGGGSGYTNNYSAFTIGALNDGGGATTGQGRIGGAGGKFNGAGGGGAVGAGGNATDSSPGAGGTGRTSAITGGDPAPTFARGGAGAPENDNSGFVAAVDGTGDGGDGRSGGSSSGGAGGSGVVVIRYAI